MIESHIYNFEGLHAPTVMATVTSAWLLFITVMAGSSFSVQDAAVNPSPPDCHIPCKDSVCNANIICTWKSNSDSNNNLTHTLHWEGYKIESTGHRAEIQRQYFRSHSQLQVWVEIRNKDGTVSRSNNISFNTADIIKPPQPKIASCCRDPIEIHWNSPCDQLMLDVGHCEVRYHKDTDMAWIQPEEGGVSGSYTLYNPEPSTNYSFQVRCACSTSIMSDWSVSYPIRSVEKAPIGKLDIWGDCDMLFQTCVFIWKKLPMFKARGLILGYELKLHYNNGTNLALNESAAASVFLICNEVQCYYNSSLKDVKSVSIRAYNALNMTAPSHLALTQEGIPGQKRIDLEMNENNLTVTWNSTWIKNVTEIVVQYKEVGSLLGEGSDWVRVNASITKATIRGQFKKYTAYQVSVFTVMNHTVQLYWTDVTHLVQGLPAKIPLFKVLSYETTRVTLLWKTVLMSIHNGITPYYQVGYDKDNVYNVSAYPQMENRTYILTNLKEDHNYEVWIKAVNQAGPGPNTTVLFKTLATENIGLIIPLFVASVGLFILIFSLLYRRKTCNAMLSFLKVPDPHNSNIIREIKNQINDPLAWLCVPATEQHPKISVIEIINIPTYSFNSKSDHEMNYDDADLEEERKKTHCGSGKQEYSKMVDSDEEKNEDEEETGSSSSEEGDAGYEQHFMPTNIDIKEMHERERAERSWGEE